MSTGGRDRDAPRTRPPEALEALRAALGASTRIFGGPAARHLVEPGLFVTISGTDGFDYNVVGVTCADETTARRALDELATARVPGLVFVGGPGLATVGLLDEAGFVPVSSLPLMYRRLAAGAEDGRGAAGLERDVHRLRVEELDRLRSMVSDTFGVSGEHARLAVPDEAGLGAPADRHLDGRASYAAWAVDVDGETVSGVTTSLVGGDAVFWSMATSRDRRRKGYGRCLFEGVLEQLTAAGATGALLLASPEGERLYRTAGLETLEVWQLWTSRRWVLR